MQIFPSAYWISWDCDATFLPGEELPAESRSRLYAVLAFVFYGDKVVLADIAGRGLCIPSGRIERGETIDAAIEREAFEEIGARLSPERRRLIGCYRLVTRSGSEDGQASYCPVFIAEATGFEPLPSGTESQGRFLAAMEDVADLYYHWDALMAAVFAYAADRRNALLPLGSPVSALWDGRISGAL